MPGGIGGVSAATLSACVAQDRAIDAVAGANEIFFHLDARRVYVDRAAGCLYFAAAGDGVIRGTLDAVFAGMGCAPAIEQLHLDAHRFFSAASRVVLDGRQLEAALVALRLAGVRATVR